MNKRALFLFVTLCISLYSTTQNEIKKYIKEIFTPLISPICDIILNEIYPYIYLSLIFVLISFLLHLGIFFLLLRNKSWNFTN